MPKVEEPPIIWHVNTHDLARRGQAIFERISPLLEAEHRGKFIAIEPDSGDYFIATRGMEAIDTGRAKHPDKLFYLARIGFPAAVIYSGYAPC